ncbi:phosphodiester glycosidase family protein [Candidatus Woesebacteria bacterium]|nr:phosphodiester glycosidase family protein [Candidatus Woesebacteria bacterium]
MTIFTSKFRQFKNHSSHVFLALIVCGSFLTLFGLVYGFTKQRQSLRFQVEGMEAKNQQLSEQVSQYRTEITNLEQEDQRVRNDQLQEELKTMQAAFKKSLASYESLLDLKEGKGKSSVLDKQYALVLSTLSSNNYASASSLLASLDTQIQKEQEKIASQSATVAVTAVASNTPPGSGFSRQKVQTSAGEFVVDIIAADLRSSKVIVDTASDSTCTDNCPVLPLASYVSRSGAFAGINGTYFCPESYPTCAGKKNSFDLLVMNKNKAYFNSDNNVYSQNPVAVFSGTSARFFSKAQDWGRDTGVDSVISNFPLLVINGQNQFGGNGDPKMSSRGVRGFLAAKDTFAYMGFVRNATVAEAATVLQTLGMQHALNLDSGGSSALWFGGYKLGPGRSIPNAVLFVRK